MQLVSPIFFCSINWGIRKNVMSKIQEMTASKRNWSADISFPQHREGESLETLKGKRATYHSKSLSLSAKQEDVKKDVNTNGVCWEKTEIVIRPYKVCHLIRRQKWRPSWNSIIQSGCLAERSLKFIRAKYETRQITLFLTITSDVLSWAISPNLPKRTFVELYSENERHNCNLIQLPRDPLSSWMIL